ncbi:(2Fe-2S)-binding protein [Roseicella aquatilis]|uniref:(2Fe-2S)-binding protein n=1 Tax=Roseicella aquatilis TaxID=2527868 RepID=UPI001F10F233|nr:(2Fe-2S)-binding protein [Roseicella aquatilis]
MLCLCNGLSDRQVAQCIREGAARPRDIYAACGGRAQCGTCTRLLLRLLRASAPPDVHGHQEHQETGHAR